MSKLLNDEDSGEYETWTLPDVDDLTSDSAAGRLLTASQLENIQKQAYQEGYDDGFKKGETDGFAAGQDKASELVKMLQSLIDYQAEPIADVNEEVIQQMVDLAIVVAKQVVRRELKTDPGQVVAVIRECIKSLPASARGVMLHIHPEDAIIVREAFSLQAHEEVNWRIEEDPMITRGGCRIEAEHSTIDATVEQQLNRIIFKMLGGEREDDSGA